MQRLVLAIASVAFTGLLAFGTDSRASAQPGPKGLFLRPGINAGLIGNNRLLFHSRNFRGFTATVWIAPYRCYALYSPLDRMWFYWYQPLQRFQPTFLLSVQPPPTSGLGFATLLTGPGNLTNPAVPPGSTVP